MRDTPEARATRAILLATTPYVDWHRNNVGCYDANPECPHCHRRARPGPARVIVYGVGGKGGSDYLGIVRATGQLIAAEIKSATGRPSPEQLQFLERVRLNHGLGVLARVPADILQALGVRA